jgi:hypothetical protein
MATSRSRGYLAVGAVGFDMGLQADVIPTIIIIIIIILLLLFTRVRSGNLHIFIPPITQHRTRLLHYRRIIIYNGIVIDENNRKILMIPPRYVYMHIISIL